MQRSAGIQQLGNDLLGRVLLLIPQGQRLRAAEVCRAWCQLLRRPDMWTTVEYNPRSQLEHPTHPENNETVTLDALAWLTSRSHSTRTLHIQGGQMDASGPPTQIIDSKIQTVMLAFAAAPALVELHLQVYASLAMSCSSLSHIKLLTGLTKLQTYGATPPMTTSILNSLFSSLPALQVCLLDITARGVARANSKAELPTALYSCTRLTSLDVYDYADEPCMDWGGLSAGIAALQRLEQLRLQTVVSAPLTATISALTNLTALGLHSDLYGEDDFSSPLLPAVTAALTGLRQLDIDAHFLPPALEALTGIHDLTLREMDVTFEDLAKLSAMRHLSRLRLCSVGGSFLHGDILQGLDGCRALRQLHLSDCGVAQLSDCRVLRQLTDLRLQINKVGMSILALVAEAMPQLVTLDLSYSSLQLTIVPSEVIDALQRCASLRHLWCELPSDRQLPSQMADALVEVQRAVPRVHWHMSGAWSDQFDLW